MQRLVGGHEEALGDGERTAVVCREGRRERGGRRRRKAAAADLSESRGRWRVLALQPYEIEGASKSQREAGGGRDGRGYTQGKNGREVEEGGDV